MIGCRLTQITRYWCLWVRVAWVALTRGGFAGAHAYLDQKIREEEWRAKIE